MVLLINSTKCLKNSHQRFEEEILANSFYEACITLMPKQRHHKKIIEQYFLRVQMQKSSKKYAKKKNLATQRKNLILGLKFIPAMGGEVGLTHENLSMQYIYTILISYKNNMIILCRKSFDKIQLPFLIKALKLGIQLNFLNLTKTIYQHS